MARIVRLRYIHLYSPIAYWAQHGTLCALIPGPMRPTMNARIFAALGCVRPTRAPAVRRGREEYDGTNDVLLPGGKRALVSLRTAERAHRVFPVGLFFLGQGKTGNGKPETGNRKRRTSSSAHCPFPVARCL